MREVSVYETLDRLQRLLQSRGRERRVELSFLKPATDLHFPADPELLEQVLINLGYHAIDACTGRPGGRVTFSAQRSTDQRLLFAVADNGTGIEEELLSKIFVPFFTTKQEGSGIGLSVSPPDHPYARRTTARALPQGGRDRNGSLIGYGNVRLGVMG